MPGSIFGLGIRLEADDRLSRGVRQAERAMGRASEGAKAMRRAVQAMGRQLGMTRRTLASAKRDIDAVSNSMSQLGSAQRNTGVAFAAAGAAVGAGLGLAVNEAAQFEHIMAEVQQKSGLADSQIDDLGNRLSLLASKLPLADKELAKVAVVAAQLGVAANDGVAGVESLAFSAAKLANTSDLTEEAAAQAIARLSKKFNLPIAEADKMASSMVLMANTTTANVSTIVEISNRFGGMANAAGLAASEVIAMSAVMVDAGINAEEAGSSLTKMIQKMAVPKNMAKFAEQLQVPIEEYTRMINEDALGTTLKFLDTFKGMKTTEVVKALSEMQLARVGTTKTVLGLSNMSEQLRDAIDNSRMAFANGTELDRAFEAMLKTLTSKMKTLMGSIVTFARSVGVTLFPIIKPAVDAATMFVGVLLRLPAPIKMAIGLMAALTSGALLVAGAGLILSGTLGLLTAGSLSYAKTAGITVTANSALGISMQILGTQLLGVWKGLVSATGAAGNWIAKQMASLVAGNAWILVQWESARATWFNVAALKSGVRWLGLKSLALLKFANIGFLQAIPMTWKFIFGLTHWNRATITASLSTTAFGRAVLAAATTGYAALTPLLPVILAIGGAALVVWAAWRPLKSLFLGVWEGIQEGLRPVVDTFRFAFREIGEAVEYALVTLSRVFGVADGAGDTIRSLGHTVAQALLWWTGFNLAIRTVGLALRAVLAIVGGVIRGLAHLVNQIGRPIAEAIQNIKEALGGASESVQWFLSATGGAGDGYLAVFQAIADGSAWAVKWLTPLGHMTSAFRLALDLLGAAAEPIVVAFAEIGSAFSDVGQFISGVFTEISTSFGGSSQVIGSTITMAGVLTGAMRVLGRMLGWLVAGPLKGVAWLVRVLGTFFGLLAHQVGLFFRGTAEAAKPVFTMMKRIEVAAQVAMKGLSWYWRAVTGFIGDAAEFASSMWTGLWTVMRAIPLVRWAMDVGSAFIDYIMKPLEGIRSAVEWVLEQLGALPEALETATGNKARAAAEQAADKVRQQTQVLTGSESREEALRKLRAASGFAEAPGPSLGSFNPAAQLAGSRPLYREVQVRGLPLAAPRPERHRPQPNQRRDAPRPFSAPVATLPWHGATSATPMPSRAVQSPAPPVSGSKEVHVHVTHQHVTLEVDGRELARTVISSMDENAIRSGRDPGMTFLGVG